jgi:hypothetical protein
VAKNVQSIIDDLESGLTLLRMHFESLGSIFGGERTASGGRNARKTSSRRGKTKGSAPVTKARKKTTMSPARRTQLKLQGRYMALVKRLPKGKQAQVKKVRKEKGYEAALKMMG